MEQLQSIWQGLDWSKLTGVALSILPALICITVHELCHGLAAYALGDMTAKNMGRLTLNPIRHIDVMGLVMMAIFKFGWAKPVPVNPNNFKNPKRGMALTALAGPASNIVLAAAMMVLYGYLWRYSGGIVPDFAQETILNTAYLSIALCVFNLLPIPPLDGSKILFGMVLTDNAYDKLMRYERYGMALLILLMWSDVTNRPLSMATMFIFERMADISIYIMRGGL